MSVACPQEERMLTQLAERGRLDDALTAHVAACAACRDLAGLVQALRTDAARAAGEASLPTASQVWWRARVRARLAAAQSAERPISIAQSLSIAALAGLAVSFFSVPRGTALLQWLQTGWSPWAWAVALATGVLVLLMPLAALLASSRE